MVINEAAVPLEKGDVDFPCIEFTKVGTYHFKIKEITQSGNGWETDPREFPVIVIITDENGKLKATVEYPDGYPEFTNNYKPEAVCVPLTANKCATGAPLKEGQFEFGVYDEAGRLVCSAKNEAPY